MVRKRFALGVALVALFVLLWATGGVVAGPPAEGPEGDVTIAGTVAESINYQGRLTDRTTGNPLSGNYDMEFQFWDSDTGGNQVGSTIAKSGVPVANGLFNVELDVDQDDFNGQELWLQVRVRPSGGTWDPWMTDRQQILPAPYALSLRPGAYIKDEDVGHATFSVQNGSPGGFWILAKKAIEAWTNDGTALWGAASSGTAVYGIATLADGYGGYFVNSASSGTTYGVYGKARSPDGYGGYFKNEAGNDGTGVYGEGAIYGVRGKATISSWVGDFPPPVYGVYGETVNLPGFGYGVYGKANTGAYGFGTTNDGVVGWADAEGPYITRGVVGWTRTTNDRSAGVYGEALNSGGGHGIYAKSAGGAYAGATLLAENTNTTNGIAIWGKAKGNDSTMVLEHKAGAGDFIRAFQTEPGDLRFRVDVNGNVYRDGTCSSPASDFAELLPAVGGLGPGDVLVIGADGQLIRSTEPYQSSVVGVYSTKPAFLGGADEDGDMDGKAPLAIVGVVPVKASAENGPVKPGDLLTTSSTPGHAMKADRFVGGAIIGKALEGLSEGAGVIKMLVMLQ